MTIRVPKEIKQQEFRIAMPPSGGESNAPEQKMKKVDVCNRTQIFLIVAGAMCLAGCVRVRWKEGNGDVGEFILREAVAAGARPKRTNDLPLVYTQWRYSGNWIELTREDFPKKIPALEEFLRLSFGTPVSRDQYWRWGDARRTNEIEIQLYPLEFTAKRTVVNIWRMPTNRYESDWQPSQP